MIDFVNPAEGNDRRNLTKGVGLTEVTQGHWRPVKETALGVEPWHLVHLGDEEQPMQPQRMRG